jgi:hypothetical protein
MIRALINLLFGCRHRRITRPMTATHKAAEKPGVTYVTCLDCGQQFHYDLATMKMGTLIAKPSKLADGHFQAPN